MGGRRREWWVLLSGVLLLGCATADYLFPAPGVPTAPGRPDVASVQEDGVVLMLDDVGSGGTTLPPGVKAVHVSVVNQTDQPLRLHAKDFSLDTAGGVATPALPPYQVAQVAGQYAWAMDSYWPGYYGAWPGYSFRNYPGWGGWGGPWAYGYSDAWSMRQVAGRVVDKALPEGALEPGGHAEGLVYFRQPPREVGDLALRLRLTDAQDQEPLGEVEVPLRLLSRKEARAVLKEGWQG